MKKNGGFVWSYSHDIPVFTDIMEFDASIAVEYDSFYRNILPLIKIVKLIGNKADEKGGAIYCDGVKLYFMEMLILKLTLLLTVVP